MSVVRPNTNSPGVVLDVRKLKARGSSPRSSWRRAPIPDDRDGVSFLIREGEALGLVGESGSGKSTLLRCILRIEPPQAGQILYHGAEGVTVDWARLPRRAIRRLRQQVRLILSASSTSPDQDRAIGAIVGEPLTAFGLAEGDELQARVVEALRQVGLEPDDLRRSWRALPPGERQRIAIARALVVQPRLVLADEITSALDMVPRGQVLALLQELRQASRLTWLFAVSDLGQAHCLCDRVAVLYAGRLAEVASPEELVAQPLHPYTEALLAAAPWPDPRLGDGGCRTLLAGGGPDLANPPTGCRLHPRCSYVQERCRNIAPRLGEVRPGHLCACHRADELALRGIGSREI